MSLFFNIVLLDCTADLTRVCSSVLRNLIFFLLVTLFNTSSFALTITSDGSDCSFIPSIDTILTVPVDGIFNFSDINIDSGVDLTFDRGSYTDTIWLTSISDISILGNITWVGSLGINSSSGTINLSGNLSGDLLSIESNIINVNSGDTETGSISVGDNGGTSISVGDSLTIGSGGSEVTLTSDDSNSGDISLNTGDGINGTVTVISGDSGNLSISDGSGGEGQLSIISGGNITIGATDGINGDTGPITIGGDIVLSSGNGDGTLIVTASPVPLPFLFVLLLSAFSFLFPAIKVKTI